MKCLRCPDEDLVDDAGALGEAVCRRCRGRFLNADATERVFDVGVNVDRAMLADLVRAYPGRARCPACSKRMSIPSVRGVAVDVCGGCGGCFLDGGELARISMGRFDEQGVAVVEPPPATPAAFPALPDAAVGGGARDGDRGWAVFVVDPRPAVDRVVAAFAAAAFRTAIDARVAATRAEGGVVVDDLGAADAHRLAQALDAQGVPARAVDRARLALPHVVRARGVVVDGDALVVPDALGRPQRHATRDVRLLAAARARVVAPQAVEQRTRPGTAPAFVRRALNGVVPGLGTLAAGQRRAAQGQGPSTELREIEETFVDVVLVDVRLRFDETSLLGQNRERQTLRSLVDQLDAAIATAVPRHRGFVAVTRGSATIDVRSLRELEREEAWALWKATSSS